MRQSTRAGENNQDMIMLNTMAVVGLTRAFLPHMISHKHGRVMIVSSVAGIDSMCVIRLGMGGQSNIFLNVRTCCNHAVNCCLRVSRRHG